MKRILLAGAALFALTAASSAADLVLPPEPVVDDWSGFYVGLQAGYAFGDVSVDSDALGFLYDDDYEGAFGGIYWGRNWQFDNWVLGLDGSFQIAAIDAGDGIIAAPDVETEFFTASRARIGYAFDNVLLFAAGGFSLAKVNVDDGLDDDDAYLKGWTVGAGVDVKFSSNWSARLEYMYFSYDTEQRTLFDGGGETYQIDVDDVHAIRAGVAYHF